MEKNKKDILTHQGRALVNAMREEKVQGRELFPTPFCMIYLNSVYENMVRRAIERKENAEKEANYK